MDFKDFEGTTAYAIEAVYKDYWNLIPERYRISEKSQRGMTSYDDKDENGTPIRVNPKLKPTAMSYDDVEKQQDNYGNDDQYDSYVDELNKKNEYFDVMPFYDPELDFENRLHYKLVGVPYPKRQYPWFIITWNHGDGIIHSELSRRIFQTCMDTTPTGETVKFDFKNTFMELTLCIYSNTMQGLLELQENIIINKREKAVLHTALHSILGSFVVSTNIVNTNVTKFPREKGTICMMTLVVQVDFPVIGHVTKEPDGLIKQINYEVDEGEPTDDGRLVLTSDTIRYEEENE